MTEEKKIWSSTKILVEALEEINQDGAVNHIIQRARADWYHDFFSPSETGNPQAELIIDIRKTKLPAVVKNAFIERVVNGDFDGTKEESEAWAASPDGIESFQELMDIKDPFKEAMRKFQERKKDG